MPKYIVNTGHRIKYAGKYYTTANGVFEMPKDKAEKVADAVTLIKEPVKEPPANIEPPVNIEPPEKTEEPAKPAKPAKNGGAK